MCEKCNCQVSSAASFCPNCGSKVVQSTQVSNSNIQLFKVLAYIGPLWLIGLLCKEKNDEKLKFHVGQGIMITILAVITNVINVFLRLIARFIIINDNRIFGQGYESNLTNSWATSVTSLFGLILSSIPLILMIIGIIHVAKNEEEPLPFIGEYAFYK